MTQNEKINHRARHSPIAAFYHNSMKALLEAGVDFVVGGAYALRHHTGIARDTKDLDLFVRPSECHLALAVLEKTGYRTEVVNSAWLAKAYADEAFIDIIFRSGNGVAEVDDVWFERAETMRLFNVDAPVSPAEEVIWSKAFTMERERFDLADVVHIIQAKGPQLNWAHLIERFGAHWRVLYAYLVLFGYIFPGEKKAIPNWVMEAMAEHMRADLSIAAAQPANLCQGTLLSGTQYLVDILYRGYKDARFCEPNSMSDEDRLQWKMTVEKELVKRLKEAALILPPELPKPAALSSSL